MRRPTLIMLVVLMVLLTVAAVTQLVIATGDQPTLPGPTSPGQLPSASATQTS